MQHGQGGSSSCPCPASAATTGTSSVVAKRTCCRSLAVGMRLLYGQQRSRATSGETWRHLQPFWMCRLTIFLQRAAAKVLAAPWAGGLSIRQSVICSFGVHTSLALPHARPLSKGGLTACWQRNLDCVMPVNDVHRAQQRSQCTLATRPPSLKAWPFLTGMTHEQPKPHLRRVGHQDMRQQLLAGGGDWDILWHCVVGRDNVFGVVLLLCIEGVAPIQQGIQDDAARPDVCLLQQGRAT